jgi:basic membrane protein A
VESKTPADYKTNLTQLATQGYDLIVAVGLTMEDALKEVAPQFPNTKFAFVDGDAPEGTTNIVGLKFREEQGTFLVGYLAAAMSKTKKIGFVGGQEIPHIKKFEAGYRAGAKTADPNVQVLSVYTGVWNDLSKGKSQAAQLFGNGVDIIFHAAGKCGLGVIAAAQSRGAGYYAIGVDQDQDGVAPGRVLTSMIKRVDVSVFDTIQRVKENTFTAGNVSYDLKQKGIGLSERKYTQKDIPAGVQAKLEKLTQMVAEGKVQPPNKMTEVAGFVPPKIE